MFILWHNGVKQQILKQTNNYIVSERSQAQKEEPDTKVPFLAPVCWFFT